MRIFAGHRYRSGRMEFEAVEDERGLSLRSCFHQDRGEPSTPLLVCDCDECRERGSRGPVRLTVTDPDGIESLFTLPGLEHIGVAPREPA